MDHEQAIASQAAERYALKQMSSPEAEDYEKHYFGCEECARDLESATSFVENARAAFSELPPIQSADYAPGPPGWLARLKTLFREPIFVAACASAAVLALVTAYQSAVVLPSLRGELALANQPRAFLSFAVKASTRGGENTIQIGKDTGYFAINLDLPEYAHPRFRCEVQGNQGGWHHSVLSAAPPAGSPLAILLPAWKMPSGAYDIRVFGHNESAAGSQVATFSFVLKKEGEGQ